MTSKKYLKRLLLLSVVCVLTIVAINVYLDEYGLFSTSLGKRCYVYMDSQERLDKYLFTYNYIPTNFEGVLIGPSLSDNLDTKQINNIKLYNLSINGGIATELRCLVDNLMRNNQDIHYLVICLDPYITQESGKKSNYMTNRDYYMALASIDLYKRYALKTLVTIGSQERLWNEYGYYDFCADKPIVDVEKLIKQGLTYEPEEIIVDVEALHHLQEIINTAHQNKLKVFAYYYPRPHELYLHNKEQYIAYQLTINKLFTDEDILWDFNDEEYMWFSSDCTNYVDGSHLSRKGAALLCRLIEEKLTEGQR